MTTLTKSEKIAIDIKEIAQRIKKQLKKEFPDCKFSATIERYSMGQSLCIALMAAPWETILNGKKYAQLNHFTLVRMPGWNNGTQLTPQAWKVLKRATEIANYYNYDDSDATTDYYNVNFAIHIEIGKWNKPFRKI